MSDLAALIDGVRNGRVRSVARLITRVENDAAVAETAVDALYPHTGRAHIVGVTGAPGAGKSSLVTVLAKALRQRDLTLGIIAVDPSSPFTGGALLGDRVRMRELAGDRGVFIRSMASRGRLGGLAQATGAVMRILDAAGYDLLLVETVGAGQAEVDIAGAAHTTLVVEAPGMGDDVQAIKAGILEIADILVVNKADKPGARGTVKALKTMLHLGPTGGTRHHGRIEETPAAEDEQNSGAWQIPVVETIALDGTGIDRLADTIEAHHTHLTGSGQWLARETERSAREMNEVLQARLLARVQHAVDAKQRHTLATAVAAREMTPYAAVDEILRQLNEL